MSNSTLGRQWRRENLNADWCSISQHAWWRDGRHITWFAFALTLYVILCKFKKSLSIWTHLNHKSRSPQCLTFKSVTATLASMFHHFLHLISMLVPLKYVSERTTAAQFTYPGLYRSQTVWSLRKARPHQSCCRYWQKLCRRSAFHWRTELCWCPVWKHPMPGHIL